MDWGHVGLESKLFDHQCHDDRKGQGFDVFPPETLLVFLLSLAAIIALFFPHLMSFMRLSVSGKNTA